MAHNGGPTNPTRRSVSHRAYYAAQAERTRANKHRRVLRAAAIAKHGKEAVYPIETLVGRALRRSKQFGPISPFLP